jgi:hypothetical protein
MLQKWQSALENRNLRMFFAEDHMKKLSPHSFRLQVQRTGVESEIQARAKSAFLPSTREALHLKIPLSQS